MKNESLRPLWPVVCLLLAFGGCRVDEFVTPAYHAMGGSPGGGGGGGSRAGSGGAARGGAGGSAAGGGASAGVSGQAGAATATGGAGGADAAMAAEASGGGDLGGGAEVAAPAPAFVLEGLATWRGNATAAYSLVHEVVCDPSTAGVFTQAAPELDRRSLRGGFGVVVGRCESGNHWSKVKTLIDAGHDVFSNTYSHLCLSNNAQVAAVCDPAAMRSTNFMAEIDRARLVLEERVGVGPGFLLFPFDACDPAALTRAKGQGYLGARCGRAGTMSGVNAADFADPFAVVFDLWGPGYSSYRSTPACMGVRAGITRPAQAPAACRSTVFTRLLDDAVARKGWAMRSFHGFDGDAGAFEPVAPAEYRAHLDEVVKRVEMNQLWVDGPTAVVRYRMAREHCPRPTIDGGNTLRFAAPGADCSKHAAALTYLVKTADGADLPSLGARQAGVTRPARKLGPGSFAVDADPTKGDATLF